ncbi:LOW QUALITY PROTEIN: hypothetical protein Cgig2_010183 [Carnegiea gigantea]|uniref:Reverse transcriptase zinc-binding domain-containing protein n=1 Tax=Carnegiea gigantea TaxID=171969 RepID=A0A9Q1KB73_9CARY|nr:LOW QUALITY PROTEIN: hypothetical protein Cgig2_010183 [Carnegiea gigantea]
MNKVEEVTGKTFPGWQWIHNFTQAVKGRIWLAWRPGAYQIEPLLVTDQLIHTKATQTSTYKLFYLSICQHLWDDLTTVSHNLASAWCIIGDFNIILVKVDWIRGNEVQESDVRELNSLIDECALHELKSVGPYFSWTNKSIYSWIDHAFINAYWHEVFDYTHSNYKSNGLSDHTPIVLQFSSSPKPQSSFQYCDMWGSHPAFSSIIASFPPPNISSSPLHALCKYLDRLRTKLRQLNRDHFADLSDPTRIKQEREAQEKYISILSSSIALIKQQSKLERIKYGDDCTGLFFAKAKQRNLSTYIYTLKTGAETQIEGFEKIGEIIFIKTFWAAHQPPDNANPSKSQMVLGGCNATLQEQCQQVTGFKESSFPLKYLGVPITASKLSKLECRALVDKIVVKGHMWATRNLSFAGRAQLINSIIFVVDRIIQICRNFLWGGGGGGGGTADFKKPPRLSWGKVCLEKKSGSLEKKSGVLGIRDFHAWNKAVQAKLIWAVALKKDMLWVRWVHGKYLKSNSWWNYRPGADNSWYWNKLCFFKDSYNKEEEDEAHLFFDCEYAQEIWSSPHRWWVFLVDPTHNAGAIACLLKNGGTQDYLQISYAIFSAAIYYIWRARNLAIFNHQMLPSRKVIHLAKEQIKIRVLFLHTYTKKYTMYIEQLLCKLSS